MDPVDLSIAASGNTIPPPLTGSFVLASKCASGAFSDVFKSSLVLGTSTTPTRTTVAIKIFRVFPDDLGPDKHKAYCKLLHEISIKYSRVQHPNLSIILGVSYSCGPLRLPGIITPWYPNGNIVSYTSESQYPTANKLLLLSKVCSGLAHLHSYSLVHRDIRGANILIADHGIPILVDAGLDFAVRNVQVGLTSELRVARWRSPEVLLDENPYSFEKADVYSMAMTVLETLDGKKPFSHIHSHVQASLHVMKGNIPKRPSDTSAFPNETWVLLTSCWGPENARPTATSLSHRLSILGSPECVIS